MSGHALVPCPAIFRPESHHRQVAQPVGTLEKKYQALKSRVRCRSFALPVGAPGVLSLPLKKKNTNERDRDRRIPDLKASLDYTVILV